MKGPKECETCKNESCPLIFNEKGNAKRCPVNKDLVIRRKISKMIYGVKDRNIKTFNDLDFKINNIKIKVDAIKGFFDSEVEIMILISPNGTGKTHILQALLYDCLKKGIDCHYVSAKDLRTYWITRDSNYNLFVENEYDLILQDFMGARFRLIDELGGEGITKSDHFETNFIDLLKSGYPKIIMATNLEPNEIFKDNRTLSILSGAAVIRWKGIDYRKLKE